MKVHRSSWFVGVHLISLRGFQLAMVLALGLAFALVPVTSASAATYTFEYNVAYNPAVDPPWPGKCMNSSSGYACYIATGDYLEVADFRADGMGTGIQWTTDYGRFGLCHNRMGSRSIGYCNKNFAEGRKIIFRYGRCDAEPSSDNCRARGWIWETGWMTVST